MAPSRQRPSGCAGGRSADSASSGSVNRTWLAILFGFSTQILWITTRGGVWHTGQLIATLLTFGCLLELWGGRRHGWSGCWPEPRS